MPTYDFSCPTCQETFETFSTIKDYNGKATCPTCNKETEERVFTNPLSGSVVLSDDQLGTVRDLAARNRDRMSDDHKADLTRQYNEYKNNKPKKELPKGMSYFK